MAIGIHTPLFSGKPPVISSSLVTSLFTVKAYYKGSFSRITCPECLKLHDIDSEWTLFHAGKLFEGMQMKQKKLTEQYEPTNPLESVMSPRPIILATLYDEELGDVQKNPLWPVLVETTRRNPLYPGLASYLQAKILPTQPDIAPRELASRLSISLGEALVLLYEAQRAHAPEQDT